MSVAGPSSRRPDIAGRIAARFQDSPLTPVLALLGLLLGVAAVLITPREEEPQIDVTMANVFVPFPGADAPQVEQIVTWPLEQTLSEIEGVRHLYSITRPGVAAVTVEFEVGLPRQTALVRLYDKVFSNQDWLPPSLGTGPPIVKPKGIDDVPVMTLTLWTDDPGRGPADLAAVAHSLENALKRIPGTRNVYTVGAPDRAIMVELDPGRLASHGLAVRDVADALEATNLARHAGEQVSGDGAATVTAGRLLANAGDVASVALAVQEGHPVRLSDVATVRDGADLPARYVWHGTPPGAGGPLAGRAPAVTLAVAKQPGTNAADITRAVREEIGRLEGLLIPDGIHVEVTRDYGATANEKARALIQKLVLATTAVVLLVLVALGRREALVIGAAVVLTLALTLFASWAMGFTLNRVSLFALIFAIGILVDDAIVIVENIHRHMRLGGRSLREAIPPAVDEVGGPTILATFTVIAALMPMAFVSGLMGPYMRPIPVNASVGMLISLIVALAVTPWLALRLLRPVGSLPMAPGEVARPSLPERLRRLFARLLAPFLAPDRGSRRRGILFTATLGLVAAAISLLASGVVILKMLPFDNKSELQIVADLPEGRTVEDTAALLEALAGELDRTPEVTAYQAYAGTASPISFNGLVRQYDLRTAPHQGDLQVQLRHRSERRRSSHELALALRPALAATSERFGASVKVVEIPPGPPVLAPVVAEVYGPDHERMTRIGQALEALFRAEPGIVDVDSSIEAEAPRHVLRVDQARAARRGVSPADVVEALTAGLAGLDATYLIDAATRYPKPVRLRLPGADRAFLDRLLDLPVRGQGAALLPISELVTVETGTRDAAIHHKDLLPVVYVMADEAGLADSPLYGMFRLVSRISQQPVGGEDLTQHFVDPPPPTAAFGIRWDGEWRITYETFLDMGIAYAAGIVLIYLLLVAYFRFYLVPLVIMAPIPLTIIGVMPGHALLGAPFTATSMIGMIALAGIIVRNSILLVDFINHEIARGVALEPAIVEACAVRAQPIALTALAAMAGAAFILDDPIFNGLAISLIFGILISTLLTLVIIPLLYYALLRRRQAKRRPT